MDSQRMLVDSFGRVVTDLRISVTSRCNFSCIYCHNEGLGHPPLLPDRKNGEMSPDEIGRYVRIARELGIGSVKLTGGEPLVRRDLEEIVDRCVQHVSDVSLTTNGSALAGRANALRLAGLKRINVSLDSLNPDAFKDIRHGSLQPVLAGVRAALEAGLKPVKLNLVVMKQTMEYIPAMIDYVGGTKGLKLQLIQFMPELVRHEEWSADMDELKEWLEKRADSVITREMHHRRIYHLNGAEVEVVDPVRNPEFCANCHRIRLTHDARLKGCLNRNDNLVQLRGLDDDGVREAFRRVAAERVPYYGVFVRDSERETIPGRGSFSKMGERYLRP
jgi:cyclic pyranopterin phosphate synthase